MTGADGYLANLEGEMMAFDDVWDDAKMRIVAKRMRELALTERASKPTVAIGKDYTSWLGWEGESHDLAPRTASDGLKKAFVAWEASRASAARCSDRSAGQSSRGPAGVGDRDPSSLS